MLKILNWNSAPDILQAARGRGTPWLPTQGSESVAPTILCRERLTYMFGLDLALQVGPYHFRKYSRQNNQELDFWLCERVGSVLGVFLDTWDISFWD